MNEETRIKLRPLVEEIAICAYLIWEKEDRPSGRDRVHWIEAEEQLQVCQAHDQWMKTP